MSVPTRPSKTPNDARRLAWFAIAACLLVIGVTYIAVKHFHAQTTAGEQVASSQPIKSTMDLFDSGTLRGTGDDAMPLREAYLPAATVRLSVILPRFSEPGNYRIDVSTNRTGKQIIASGTGNTAETGDGKLAVEVSLDLRTAKPGAYFLATVRGVDNGTYYYPLKVQ